jgi:hypothetical protein
MVCAANEWEGAEGEEEKEEKEERWRNREWRLARCPRHSRFLARARVPLSTFFTHVTGTVVGERTCWKTRE